MELNKNIWTKDDILPFQNYLESLGRGKEKAQWEQRIVCTKLPCLAVPCDKVRAVVSEISKGNALSFVELWIWENHTNTQILAGLISKIKDFDTQKKYITKLASYADSWATTDSIKIKPNDKNKKQYFEFAKELLLSDKPFVKRQGLIILLKLASFDDLADDILGLANTLFDETHYYVNMANAWLICEMMIKHRDKTLEFLMTHKLNDFTINKMISKCRDSYRVSDADKQLLLKYKIKKT